MPELTYELKITLQGIRPPIWRRVSVADTLGKKTKRFVYTYDFGDGCGGPWGYAEFDLAAVKAPRSKRERAQ